MRISEESHDEAMVTLFVVMPVVVFLVKVIMSSLCSLSSPSSRRMSPLCEGTNERTSSIIWFAVIPRTDSERERHVQFFIGASYFLKLCEISLYLHRYSEQHLRCEGRRRGRGAQFGRGAVLLARERDSRCPQCESSRWRRIASREPPHH